MRDTTSSVPDVVSRGFECAAPTKPEAESRGRACAAPSDPLGTGNVVTSVSGASPLREYLVDQLVITASHLAESHIFRNDPDLPFCTNCMMSGLNGRPIQHLPSCAVGRVFSAIGEMAAPAPSRQWNGWDIEHVGRAATEQR